MKVLLLGGGGREHAIGWKLAQSSALTRLVTAPGNAGLAQLGPLLGDLVITDPARVVKAAREVAADLVVVGPEAPLAAGVVDALAAEGIAAFGPTAQGARLEASKSYAKEVMLRAGIATAASRVVENPAEAMAQLDGMEPPYVVKADGLAAGKGVLVTADRDAALRWARECLSGRFGAAGSTVVIEDHLAGDEISVFAICDGSRAIPLQPARDYKRLHDGDRGPNTGGMGSFSPVPDVPPDLPDRVMADVVEPALAVLRADGVDYRGFLYVGVMLTDDGPKVLEFNCRLGDPETQVLLPRLDEDLLDLLVAAATGRLDRSSLRWSPRHAVGVVLAAHGYPEAPRRGDVIGGLPLKVPGVEVFHAGTAERDGAVVVAGGRVMTVVGSGDDLEAARTRTYAAAANVRFDGSHYRTDVGLATPHPAPSAVSPPAPGTR